MKTIIKFLKGLVNMQRKELTEQLKKHEGFRRKPYHCTADKLTIGYGRNIEDNGLTRDEAEYLLRNDIKAAEEGAKTLVKNFDRLSPARQDVIINMVFNIGMTRLSGFKKMLSALKDEDFAKASDEMLDSKWAVQVGSRATELSQTMRRGYYK